MHSNGYDVLAIENAIDNHMDSCLLSHRGIEHINELAQDIVNQLRENGFRVTSEGPSFDD